MPRAAQPRILAMIMAGGRGERLAPLTDFRTKPAVPFGGKYRIVDFVLSNFVNSGVMAIYVLVQYRSQSLIEHLRRAWRIGGRVYNNFITVVPPQMKTGAMVYEGTADAVFQNLNLIHDFSPDLVAVFGADHIYRMDVRQMVDFHLTRKAQVSVAALPVPLAAASAFGVIEADDEGQIVGWEEKPKRPKAIPGDATRAYASMGNYVFSADALVEALTQNASHKGSHDFGHDIIPALINEQRVVAYDFLKNDVPDLQAHEERGYWRDVGTIEAYWEAHMDLLGERPRFDLRNVGWPIMTDSFAGPAASLVRTRVDDSMIGQGSHLVEAEVTRSVIGRNVRIDAGCHIEESVIFDGSIIGPGSRLVRAIVDRFNVLPKQSVVGGAGSGIAVLPRGRSIGGRAVNVTRG